MGVRWLAEWSLGVLTRVCWPSPASSWRSFLRLPGSLGNVEPHRDVFTTAPVMSAAHRSGAQIIEADGDARVLVGGANAVRRIEADPAEIWHMNFSPGVTCLATSILGVRAATEIAG